MLHVFVKARLAIVNIFLSDTSCFRVQVYYIIIIVYRMHILVFSA